LELPSALVLERVVSHLGRARNREREIGETMGREKTGENKTKSLTNGSHMSYESRGFRVGGIAGLEGKINSPNKLGEPYSIK
jgi:hypothetical protein